MEVILKEDVANLGHRGDLVKVAAGYARNYLLPRRFAVAATDANRKIVEQERQAHLRRDAKQENEAADLSKLLAGVSLSISQKAGENDQLFGSVTAKDIADALEAKAFTIDSRKIELSEPIKTLGEHAVTVKLHRNVTAEIKVVVTKEE